MKQANKLKISYCRICRKLIYSKSGMRSYCDENCLKKYQKLEEEKNKKKNVWKEFKEAPISPIHPNKILREGTHHSRYYADERTFKQKFLGNAKFIIIGIIVFGIFYCMVLGKV